ncbi:hypothetical protein DXG01_004354 [Tephrocybe rancida]|nr:hypothetical protein DXG01_004354 [Tephrocybe rancida]
MLRVPPLLALIVQSSTASINFLTIQSLKLTKAPVFWTGRHGRNNGKAAADALKKNVKIGVGWKPVAKWSEACAAFAGYAQPEYRVFLVYGPRLTLS